MKLFDSAFSPFARLVDGDITVVNSADVVSYLEHRHPERRV